MGMSASLQSRLDNAIGHETTAELVGYLNGAGKGIDTASAGSLNIGATNATSIVVTPAATLNGALTLGDGVNIAAGTTTGTQIGTAITQKLGFYGATPIAQRTSANEAALTDNTGGAASTTFAAITAGAGYAQADMVAVKNALSQIVLSWNELRTTLVNLGLWKGS